MSRVAIMAVTPAWNEPASLLKRARLSVAGAADRHYVLEGGIARLVVGGRWRTQSEMRDAGRKWAQEQGRRLVGRDGTVWLLQLDADEALVHGDKLRPLLERYPWPAYPLPLVQENGDTTLAPFKLFRLPARIVACSEYVRFARDSRTWNLAGYACPPELREALLAGPFLFHTPGLRKGLRRSARLSYEELNIETRPVDAVQWPLPPLTLSGGVRMAKQDDDGTFREHEAEDGDYYCPGCGARYDTPGVCTGATESPHEATQVEAVKAAAKAAKSAESDKEAPAAA